MSIRGESGKTMPAPGLRLGHETENSARGSCNLPSQNIASTRAERAGNAAPGPGASSHQSSPAPVVKLGGVGLTLASRAGAVEILKDITLEIPAGQSLAVVGPSGSGKTSLLMIIGGLEQATCGDVGVAGHQFYGRDEDSHAPIRSQSVGIGLQ
jgi:ABC-type glutathione transport system ATPase component